MELNSQEILESQSPASSMGSQVEEDSLENNAWGRLCGVNIKIETMDLYCDEFSAGRGRDNNLVLTLNELTMSNLMTISKVHFVIKRVNCDLPSPVYIHDFSRNGTFVNNEKIGLNNTRILNNDDVISLSHPTSYGFLFKDLIPNHSMDLPEEITSTYNVNRRLGSGGFGEVRLVYDTRTCQQFALKIVWKKEMSVSDPEQVLKEANIMKDLSHPCVVRMHEVIDKPDAFYMKLDVMLGGDLLHRVMSKKWLNEENAKLYFYQTCQAVKYLHDRGIVHRDLKLANLLLATTDEETLLKVCDFGLSIYVSRDQTVYTRKVDIWSLGVVLFCSLSGTFPFADDDVPLMEERIKKAEFDYLHKAWKGVSQGAKLLINQIFTVDPKKRPSIDAVLQSSWLLDPPMMQKAKKLMKLEGLESEKENYLLEPRTKQSQSSESFPRRYSV